MARIGKDGQDSEQWRASFNRMVKAIDYRPKKKKPYFRKAKSHFLLPTAAPAGLQWATERDAATAARKLSPQKINPIYCIPGPTRYPVYPVKKFPPPLAILAIL